MPSSSSHRLDTDRESSSEMVVKEAPNRQSDSVPFPLCPPPHLLCRPSSTDHIYPLRRSKIHLQSLIIFPERDFVPSQLFERVLLRHYLEKRRKKRWGMRRRSCPFRWRGTGSHPRRARTGLGTLRMNSPLWSLSLELAQALQPSRITFPCLLLLGFSQRLPYLLYPPRCPRNRQRKED